jgi:ASC-1-like (ASCH) protein
LTTKTLWIKDEYLRWILDDRKTIEVRVAYSSINRLQIGDHLMLNDQHRFAIKRIGRYTNFQELLANENPAAIAPDIPADKLVSTLRSIYPPGKESLGVIALEIVRI